MIKASFPWAYVITNAVWIFGLAVVLAAFGWHDFLAHTRKRKLGELLRGDSFLKPLFLGLTLVAGAGTGMQKGEQTPITFKTRLTGQYNIFEIE
jgi:hypothetical protein